MATFAPSSQIALCNVPFDSTYRNQIYFSNQSQQGVWFTQRAVHRFTDYLVVRKTLPNGGVQSSVRVEKNIDDLYNCNYMMYMNRNHGDKWFYAFITDLIYINEETTEIVFETDVYQTWLFDVELKESFVVREHSVSDYLGEHRIPEDFQCADYTYKYVDDLFTLTTYGYLVALSNPYSSSNEGEMGCLHSGIYQGLYFYYFNSDRYDSMRTFFATLDIDSVQFVTVVPSFCMRNSDIGPTDKNPNVASWYVQPSDKPAEEVYEYNFDITTGLFEGYTPKNMKLYTSPFVNLIVSKHTGSACVYNIEDFNNGAYGFTVFNIYGDISTSPSVMVYPRNYQGIPHNIDSGFTIKDFTQCSTANDAYKLWWAKNREIVNAGYFAAGSQVALGAMNIFMAANAPAPLSNPGANDGAVMGGLGQVVNGVNMGLQTWASTKAAEHEANRTSMGNPSTNLLTAIGWNRFSLYKRSVKKDFAKAIDDFFTMYGYRTNKVKVPNVSSRPYFNYIQTNGINIVGAIPNDDMARLKRIYDEGITLWNPNATVGDYSVDNRP